MNPFYEQFKITHFSGEGISDDEEFGPFYKGILFQRGYGIGYCHSEAYEKYGLGFGNMLSRVFQYAVPYLKQGLQYLGKKAVRTASDIAEDALSGKNIPESATKHISATANEIFGKMPERLKRTRQNKNQENEEIETSLSPPRKQAASQYRKKKVTRRFGKKLVDSYPVLGKI